MKTILTTPSEMGNVIVTIFDITGRKATTFRNITGNRDFIWDGCTNTGRLVQHGFCYCVFNNHYEKKCTKIYIDKIKGGYNAT